MFDDVPAVQGGVAMFHADMTAQQMAKALEERFGYLQPPSDFVEAISNSSNAPPVRGMPVNVENVQLFMRIDELLQQGMTHLAATEFAVTEATQSHKDSGNDIQDKVESLIRQYRRYRRRVDGGLDPYRRYNKDSFSAHIMAREWKKAAAIFSDSKTERRVQLCDMLNMIGRQQKNTR